MKSVFRCVLGGLLCGFAAWLPMSGDAAVRVDAAGSGEGVTEPTLTAATIMAAKTEAESCRVAATLKPSADSESRSKCGCRRRTGTESIRRWGTARSAARSTTGAMTTALGRGYASARPTPARAAARLGARAPEKVVDFGWRAVHETARSKKIITATTTAPKFSYWNGCSAGGRQALKAAQRFPADFDGIIAGAPGLDWTGRAARRSASRSGSSRTRPRDSATAAPASPQCGRRRVRSH